MNKSNSNLQDLTEMANLIQANESLPNETDLLNSPIANKPYDSVFIFFQLQILRILLKIFLFL